MTKVHRTWTDEKILVFLFVEILFAKTVDIYFMFLSCILFAMYLLFNLS